MRIRVLLTAAVVLVVASVGYVYASGQQQSKQASSSSSSAPASSSSKMVVMIMKDNPGEQVPERELIQSWEKANNKQVTISVATYTTATTQTTTALEANTGADIILLHYFEPYAYASSLVDVTDLANAIAKEDGGWYPIAKRIADVNGTWRALPAFVYGEMMIYRKDLLQKAGVSVPTTWSGFRQALITLKNANLGGVKPFGIGCARSADGEQFLMSRIMASGGKLLSPDGSKVVFDSPATVNALSWMIGMIKQDLVNSDCLSWNDSTNNQAMLAGKIAVTFNSNSIKLQAEKSFPQLNPNIGTAVMPGGISYPDPWMFAIRKSSQHVAEAKDLLGYIFKYQNYEKILNETYGSAGVALQGYKNLDVWKQDDNITNLKAMSTARLIAPPSAKLSQVVDQFVIIDMVANVLNNGLTPAQAVSKAAAEIQKIYFGT